MELRVTVDPDLPKLLTEPVVAWGEFEGTCHGLSIYAPGPGPSPLSRLFVDLICGRPLPLTLVTRSLRDLPTLVAMSLFMDRTLCLHPMASIVVSAVELATHLQEGGLAHVDRDLARLIVFLESYITTPAINRAEEGRRMRQVVTWLRAYAERGELPSFPRSEELPTVVDRGTHGFVLATAAGSLVDAVIELYRGGYLRGVVFAALGNGRERVLAFRKSSYVRFDLQAAEHHLNAVEASQGQPRGWKVDRFLLSGPSKGTSIARADLIETFLRV